MTQADPKSNLRFFFQKEPRGSFVSRRLRLLHSVMRHGTRDTDKILSELPDFTLEEIEEFIATEKRQQVIRNLGFILKYGRVTLCFTRPLVRFCSLD